jgi:aconitate hydratase
MGQVDSGLLRRLKGVNGVRYVSLEAAQAAGMDGIDTMPRAFRVLAEDMLFRLDHDAAKAQIAALRLRDEQVSVSFAPGRALLQDFMGIPLMTDMAAMRDRLQQEGTDPDRLNPVIPVDFVVDHSLTVMHAGRGNALELNRQFEMERNDERFRFIKWCQESFSNFRVIPPGRGIMHQVNLEWLSTVVRTVTRDGSCLARPDTMIGTDSHTTMVNALGVLGWGVGGLEAEMAMLGMPLTMVSPRVVGIRLEGRLRPGVTATDLVLHLTEKLRRIGVVGAFVEFFGAGVCALPLADRATIANMSPEFGATCSYFPIDRSTLDYLAMTGRSVEHLGLVEAYAKEQGLWQNERDDGPSPQYDARYVFDLQSVEPCMAGPVRPDERVPLSAVPASFAGRLRQLSGDAEPPNAAGDGPQHGSVVIAAITSCTNTSNPAVMMAAGLLARNAVRRGLEPRPWVKTSMSPGSRVVTDYLTAAGLTEYLDRLGFQNVGYGCATCNGNSGPLPQRVADAIEADDLCTVAVLSGNRNFEGRIHPQIKGAYLASPPLVIVAALAGTVLHDLESASIGEDVEGRPVYLRDIWPGEDEIADHVARYVTGDRFRSSYAGGMETTAAWSELSAPRGKLFPWDGDSMFIRRSPFAALGAAARSLDGCRPLLVLGDAVTTDHISPNGAIRKDSPAGRHLIEHGVAEERLGNFGARRGNPDICLRGMFDNPLLANRLVDAERGNLTIWSHVGRQEKLSVYDAAMRYRANGIPTVIVAGHNYGAGSSRDWAAKGLRLLGVVAVIARSFERIHRTNLVGMGILPLIIEGVDDSGFAPTADDTIDIEIERQQLAPSASVAVGIARADGSRQRFGARLQLLSDDEVEMVRVGGMLPLILDRLSHEAAA